MRFRTPAIIRSACLTNGRVGRTASVLRAVFHRIRNTCPALPLSIHPCGNSGMWPGSWSTGANAIGAPPRRPCLPACPTPTAGMTRSMCRMTAAGCSTCPTGVPPGCISNIASRPRWKPYPNCRTLIPPSTFTGLPCSMKTCTPRPSTTRDKPWPGRPRRGWQTCRRQATSNWPAATF